MPARAFQPHPPPVTCSHPPASAGSQFGANNAFSQSRLNIGTLAWENDDEESIDHRTEGVEPMSFSHIVTFNHIVTFKWKFPDQSAKAAADALRAVIILSING